MSCVELLVRLRDLGAHLWVEEDRLRIRAPHGVLSDELRSELKMHRDELRELLERGKARPPLEPQERPERLPLSYAQQRLWFLCRMEGHKPIYNIALAVRLQGELEIAALKLALVDVIARHETLRTIFPEHDGVPFQLILAPEASGFVLAVEDIREEQLEERLASAAASKIELDREIPLRGWLFRLHGQCHVLLLLLHHIASDGWSLEPLAQDMARAYAVRQQEQVPLFSKLPVQYADYALWQQRLLGDESDNKSLMARQMKFWRGALAGVPEELNLPFDRRRPAVTSYRGAILPVRLDADLHRSLLGFAQESGVSLFMVLQAAWGALLWRLGAGEDIPIGTVVAGRDEPALEGLIGFFLNTLVMRTNLSGGPTFRELVARVREFALKAYAHQDVPFERLVESLQLTRSLNRQPLFQVMLVLQNSPYSGLELPGLRITSEFIACTIANFDLTLRLYEQTGAEAEALGIEGDLEYSTDLFQPSTVEAMRARLERLIKWALANPDVPLRRFEILSAEERRTLLEVFSPDHTPMHHASITGLFEEQVKRTPSAPALIFDEKTLSYAELSQQANRLAHYLKERGVGPEMRVAVCLERSLEMMIAILGILKSGGAYVPLDPAYPMERLGFMLDDSAAPVLLTNSVIRNRLPAGWVHAIELDTESSEIELQPNQDPAGQINSLQAAYVIYTSGSTGQPKGVVVPHQAVVRLVVSPNYVELNGSCRMLQLAPLSFDAATFEIWGALLNGGSLFIMGPGHASVEEIADTLHLQQINTLWLTAGLFHEVVDSSLGALAEVRQLLAGGDVLSGNHVQRVRDVFSECQVINGYGPTENTTFTACYPVPADVDVNEGVPIGFPINHTRVYVLDEDLELVPLGVTGDLFAAGSGLARGYINQPALTAERFVPDPFGAPGSRMYRTGDQVRWRANGALEFIGRADQQVKIRGHRIELGEIESVLARHTAVAKAVVIAREDQPGEKRLVGYIVAVPGQAANPAALIEYLSQTLPDYMIPSALVMLDALPLTVNGKIDRKALPSPDFKEAAAGRKPRTPLEETLCGVFADVLSVESVGIDDDFFALGGHSLLATRLVSRVRVALGVELPIQAVFEWPTVAELSQHLGVGKARTPLRHQSRPERVPLSFAQQRLWFLYRMEGPSPTYNIPFALRLHGAMDSDALAMALADVVARHETLRTIFPENDGLPFQHILPAEEARPALTIEEVSESELRERLETAAAACIHLGQEMPLRVRLFRLKPDCHVLFFLLHHIASDGWSLMPLARDVQQAYTARTRGDAPVFSELPVQYADYTLWQRSLLGDENDDHSMAAQQLEFWRNALLDAPEELNLPVDRPRPAVASYRGEMLPLRLEADLHRDLLQLAHAHGASLFMVLQAALAALLSRLGTGEDIPIGTVIAGRGEESLTELVGFFVNTLVMRADVSGNPSFVQLLQRVRSFALKAYAHQDLPFERLVEVLKPLRSLSRHPLFQVMLVLQNAPLADLELPGLTLDHQPLTHTIAKFDLTLRLDEHFNAEGEPLGIEGDLEFSSDLFDRSSAEMMAVRLVRLLKAVVSSPHELISRFDILTTEERRALLEEYNATMASPAPPASLTELFEAQSARTPNAIALTFGAHSLTYAQLNQKANRLAHTLIQLGAEPEKLVGIALEPSLELIVAAVATLKAGAAYLPLDPDYPEARLSHMLADSAPTVVISTESVRCRLPRDINVFSLDAAETKRLLDEMPADNPRSRLLPHHSAYVIYTSGSSGAPKGVVVTHHNVVRLFDATRDWISFNANDVWTLFHSYAFDFSVWEIWGALLHGGRLVIVPKTVTRSPLEFLKVLVKEQVTVLNQTPSAFYQLIDADAENAPLGDRLSIRSIIFGGEALDLSRLRRWYERHPDKSPRLVNMYGITETTVHVSYLELDEQKVRAAKGSLIGGNIPDLLIYVLDSYLEPVPVGVVGELYVAGAGVARGYWDRAALTAERFVANPYRAGGRMYRTGDVARRLSDGTLEYLGRSDQQVKIRGFRIELGEIEAALRSQPGVRHVVVIAHQHTPGEKQLVAYVVPASGATMDKVFLQHSLSEQLPEYMVPAAFVELGELPLTSNGKLDRQALPQPEILSEHYRAPRTPEEEILCGLFAEALSLERVGIDDNFFDLGGHSLIAARLTSQARSALGVELSIRALFESPTVAELAKHLSKTKTARKPLARQIRPERLPLSYAQQRLWFLYRMEGPNATYNMPIVLRLQGDLNEQALQQALWDVVARHEILRTIFPEDGGVPFQQILDTEQAHPMLIKQQVAESELDQKLSEAAATAIDLTQELPLRAWFFATGPRSHVLLLLLHHIAGDGWSLAPLAQEIEEAYAARQTGQTPNWSTLAVQYADYTLWQRELLGDENQPESLLSQQMEFWRKALAGMPEELSLDVAGARPLIGRHEGTLAPIQLSAETHRSLLKLARRCKASLFMVLLATLAALLRKLGAGDDIPIGTVIAGRDEASLEGLIGFFVKTLVMRTDLSGDPAFTELVDRVRSFALEAYGQQDLPFERLVEGLQPERTLGLHPLFQVVFVLQNTPQANLLLPDLAVSLEALPAPLAKFDVTLGLGEQLGPAGEPLGIHGALECSLDLFDQQTAEMITASFVRLAERAAASPDLPLHRLDTLSARERHALLEELNATHHAIPQLTLPDLFERQVAQTPNAVALEMEGLSLSYADLNQQANRLAHFLIARGVGPEKLVGICLERSFNVIVALLAIEKAGAAYVPLDAAYPQARLAYMMEDSVPALVISASHLRDRLPENAEILELDSPEIKSALMQLPAHNPGDPERVSPLMLHHPAYVMYTSGSTGKPKAVVVEHTGIASLAAFTQDRLDVQDSSRFLQFASLNFDVSIWDVVTVLTRGATLVLLREDQRSGAPLREVLVSRQITHAVFPPAVLPTLERPDEIPLKVLIVAGEACSGDLVDRWSKVRWVINAFGPTETTVLATVSGPLTGSQNPTIGVPTWNTRVYVLDAHLEPVPSGVTGELYVAGIGVSRGYLNRPRLTSERFVADPYGPPGSRMYRIGDLVRWRSDGTLDCLGRTDHQVKIRGHRVETGEIESALRAQNGIAQAAVVARDGSLGSKQLAAYIVSATGAEIDIGILRQKLGEQLPDYMMPASFMVLDALPLNGSGKLDRQRLPEPTLVGAQSSFVLPHSEWEHVVAGIWKEVLRLDNFSVHDNFFDLGGHSLLLAQMHTRLQKAFGASLPMVKLFEHPTVASIANYLEHRKELEEAVRVATSESKPKSVSNEIAIIGMSCRFPGAPSIEAFWNNLKQGVESVAPLNQQQLAALPQELVSRPNFVSSMGRLENLDLFDAAFFGIGPSDAIATDPQQRLLLECAWEALEAAGYGGTASERNVGVFAGSGESRYRELFSANPDLVEALGEAQLIISTGKDYVATRLSYLLDLRGPSVPVNTACSTSLVAVHMACQSLIHGECNMALAGGVSIADLKPTGYLYQESSILSPEGHCRAFDAAARGTVPGSGAGMVLLKRLDDALADGDHIHAVIKGSAINNDGNTKVGFTAPSVEGQRRVIQHALEAAGIQPQQLSYIEAHGTGTSLGDPIEVEALRQTFGKGLPTASCALGSVKTNIGHCDSAAGVAALIKAALCMEHQTLVPSLNFEQPNPQLDLARSPFFVNTQTTPWRHTQRFAGVSSFGIGGTNAHVVLGESPAVESSSVSRSSQVITLSAQTQSALEKRKAALAHFLQANAEIPLADLAFTLNAGRKSLPARYAFVCTNREEAILGFNAEVKKPQAVDANVTPSVVFLFPGQGKVYAELGRGLYQEEQAFREEVDRCSKLLYPLLSLDLSQILFSTDPGQREQLERPSLWQPALFVIEYAMAQLWMSWGVKPAAMIGHSIGEYVAATLAGVLDLEAALLLVVERARGTERLEPGSMLAVPVSEQEISPFLSGNVSLAAVNGRGLCVVSGPVAEIDLLKRKIASLHPIRLEASYAFHSCLVEPLMEPLTRLASGFKLRAPQIPYLSNVTGAWITNEEATDPEYWAHHLRETVRFADCLTEVMRQPGRILLEVGPGKVLTNLARRDFPEAAALPSLISGMPDGHAVAKAFATLWTHGAAVDWIGYYQSEKRRRLVLPTYPFERKSYWVNGNDSGDVAPRTPTPSVEVKDSLENWFYAQGWKRADLGRVRRKDDFANQERWLVFSDANGIGAQLARRLRDLGQIVTEVRRGLSFEQDGGGQFFLDPNESGDFARLLDALRVADGLPQRIIHAWNEVQVKHEDPLAAFDSLIYLAQPLGSMESEKPVRLSILTSNIHRVLSEALPDPGRATTLGIVHVLSKENPRIVCQSVDVDHAEPQSPRLLDAILTECALEASEPIVAFRNSRRWVPMVDRISVPLPALEARLDKNGVYLITHAFQEIGMALAERLANHDGTRIVLLDRAFFPQPSDWKNWIKNQGQEDSISRKIARLQGIREHLTVMTADLADRERMSQVKEEIERDLGPIAGIVHLDRATKTGLIQGKSGSPSAMLRSEMAEALVLEEIFANVEWMALFSSNLAEVGGIGQVEQAARNAMMGRFAERMAERGCRAVCIEWGTRGWQETGEDAPDSASFIYRQLEQKRQQFGMSTAECLDALDRTLGLDLPGVIISTRGFTSLMEQQHLFTTDYFQSLMQDSVGGQGNGASGGVHSRPDVSTEYLAPRTDVEKLLVETWGKSLGFQQIGVHDNFFELGGHSLLAVQVLKNLNETFSTRLGLKDLFEAPTISALAALISGTNVEEGDEALEALLAEIEGLSPERVRSELDTHSPGKGGHV